jgi:drug/metabolite transporter (DMT)-like permease
MDNPRLDRVTILLFVALLCTDVSALVMEKLASTHAVISNGPFYLSLIQQPGTWIGIGLGPVQLWVWSKILKRVELSLAFPISSFSFPVTVLSSQLILGEHIGWKIWLAVTIITLGVILIGGESDKSDATPPNTAL